MADEEKDVWGYVSYNVDDENDTKLTYTRYEKSGRVNKYSDNGDGGHSHSTWNNEDDYNAGESPDWSRSESNDSENPSEEVEERSGCYLTTACIHYLQEKFDDNCYELTTLRQFRDQYVTLTDKKHYYEVAPQIVEKLDSMPQSQFIYQYIYKNLIVKCVDAIEKGNFNLAYNNYKKSIQFFENKLLNTQEEETTSKKEFNSSNRHTTLNSKDFEMQR